MNRTFRFNLVINVDAGVSNFLLPPQRREVEEVDLESVKFHVKKQLGDAEIGPVAYITSSVLSTTVADILTKIAEVQYQLKTNSSPSCLITSQEELNKIIQECKSKNLFFTMIVTGEVKPINISAQPEKNVASKEGKTFLTSFDNLCSVCKIGICGPLYLCISCEDLPVFCIQCQSTHNHSHLKILAPESWDKCSQISKSFSSLVLKNVQQNQAAHCSTMEQNSYKHETEGRSNDNNDKEVKEETYGLDSSIKLDSSFTSLDSGEYDFGSVEDDFHVISVPDCFDTNLLSATTSSKYIIIRDSGTDREALQKSSIANPNEECRNNRKDVQEEAAESKDVSFMRMSEDGGDDDERGTSCNVFPQISAPLESALEINAEVGQVNEMSIEVAAGVPETEMVFQSCQNVSSSQVLSQPLATSQILYQSSVKPNNTSCYTRSFQEISDPFADCNEELDISQFFSHAAQKVGKAAEKTANAFRKLFRAFREDVMDSAFQVSSNTASLDWMPVSTRWSQTSDEPCDFNSIMAALVELGFANRALNKVLINSYKCNFDQIMNHISSVGYQHDDYDNSYILI